MKKLLLLTFTLVGLFASSQDAAREWTIQMSATVDESAPSITLNWLTNTQVGPDTYHIWRKEKGGSSWVDNLGTVPSSTLTFTDNTAELGISYEYRIELRLGATTYAWGYINSGINVELDPNKGDMLLVVDSTFITTLSAEIQQLSDDMYCDGWMVTVIGVNPSATAQEVKALITAQYAALPNLKGLYLLGHVPVPYSGNLYPDAHPEHEGAWPADVYYGDMDGTWTDATVNNTVAADPRNDNVPGDGKLDQSKVPDDIELQIGRVDLDNLPVFALTHEELLQNYLAKAHDFKVANYVPTERALVDQGGFVGFAEGFAQNGWRNFDAFFGDANVSEIDYWLTLSSNDYLWSYGCGAGSYTTAGNLNNDGTLSSTNLATGVGQSTFTMLFGSYFGDWDITNNLLRSAIAGGKTLSCTWAGRPNWHYHNMAMGENIGYSARISQTKNSGYINLNLGGGFVTGEGVHVALMGDPSTRMYYILPPSILSVSNVSNVAELDWTASADATIDGYNIYRRTTTGLWSKVNSSIVTGTSYSDATIPTGEEYIFMVKAVKLKTNASGSFYNESLGTVDSDFFSVGLDEQDNFRVAVYPNPTEGTFNVSSIHNLERLIVRDQQGRVVYDEQIVGNSASVDLSGISDGVYFVRIGSDELNVVKKLVIK